MHEYVEQQINVFLSVSPFLSLKSTTTKSSANTYCVFIGCTGVPELRIMILNYICKIDGEK